MYLLVSKLLLPGGLLVGRLILAQEMLGSIPRRATFHLFCNKATGKTFIQTKAEYYLGVAQHGQSVPFGAEKSKVQILPPRPKIKQHGSAV